ILVNNAGIFLPGNIMSEDPINFEDQFSVNVQAAYTCVRHIGRLMAARGSGHIFNITSIAGMANNTTGGSYAVTKAAMLSLNNVTRQELSKHGVKVTAIVPGPTRTDSWEGTTLPESAFVRPDDIAEMLVSTLRMSKYANVDEIVIRPLNFEL
ncbi:MAG: SDR family oxidoreductase, partial [Chitinophagaceae bacterium]